MDADVPPQPAVIPGSLFQRLYSLSETRRSTINPDCSYSVLHRAISHAWQCVISASYDGMLLAKRYMHQLLFKGGSYGTDYPIPFLIHAPVLAGVSRYLPGYQERARQGPG